MEPVDAIDSSVHGSKAYGLMLNHCDPNNYNSAYEILDAITSNLSPSPMEVIISGADAVLALMSKEVETHFKRPLLEGQSSANYRWARAPNSPRASSMIPKCRFMISPPRVKSFDRESYLRMKAVADADIPLQISMFVSQKRHFASTSLMSYLRGTK